MCAGRVCTGGGARGSFSPDLDYVARWTAFATVQRRERNAQTEQTNILNRARRRLLNQHSQLFFGATGRTRREGTEQNRRLLCPDQLPSDGRTRVVVTGRRPETAADSPETHQGGCAGGKGCACVRVRVRVQIPGVSLASLIKRVSGENWVLALGLGRAESPEHMCHHCTFIFWGGHAEGEKTMEK